MVFRTSGQVLRNFSSFCFSNFLFGFSQIFFFLPLSQWFTTPHLDSFVYFKRITLMPSDDMNSEYVGGNKNNNNEQNKNYGSKGVDYGHNAYRMARKARGYRKKIASVCAFVVCLCYENIRKIKVNSAIPD